MKFDVSMTFDIPRGAVTPNQLQRAILRAVNTKEFMYKGVCTVNFVEPVLDGAAATTTGMLGPSGPIDPTSGPS